MVRAKTLQEIVNVKLISRLKHIKYQVKLFQEHQKMTSESNDQLFSKIVGTVRASSALAAQDIEFCRSLNKDVRESLHETSLKMVSLINDVSFSIDQNTEPMRVGKEKLDEAWKDFSNLMDNLFEMSDRSLDLLTNAPSGKKRDGYNLQYLDEATRGDNAPIKRVIKPQLTFKNPVDNSEAHPFKPSLTEKPFAMKSLPESLRLVAADEITPEHYAHPYEHEIDHQEYSASVVVKAEPIPSQPWDSTEAVWVDNIKSLQSMLSDLKKSTEIAVDLEHHDYRSYYGIVCLMQISTRSTDYLVDTIALRDDLRVLNEIFTNPAILKVFHGAFMDIIWLQRDLGIYVVSLFDTYHASRAIGLPRHSLAYLLETFAKFKTSKKYQLADWRIRPLSKPMNAYARADTHFLLNIYDVLKNTLIEQNKLAAVLSESRNVAKRRFEYSRFRPVTPSPSVFSPIEKIDAWRTLMYQYNIPKEKENLVKKLYLWRDTIARRDDESPRYVMPNQLLVALSDQAPTNPIGVVSVSNMVTDHVRSNSLSLANLVRDALENSQDNISEISSGGFETNAVLDSATILTVPQIEGIMSSFNKVRERLNKFERNGKDNKTSLYLGNILTAQESAINYSDDKVLQVSAEQLRDRSSSALQAMEDFDSSTSYSMLIAELPEQIEDVTKGSPAAQVQAREPVAPPKEDMDEIITLKKVKDHPRKIAKAASNNDTPKESIDYKGGKKILGSSDSTGSQKASKKRRFDPYAASNHSAEAPQAPKKRRATNRGKNISFKK